MEATMIDWRALLGKWVVLNGFGIAQILGVEGDHVLVGDAETTTAIPLTIVRSVDVLAGSAGRDPSVDPAAPL